MDESLIYLVGVIVPVWIQEHGSRPEQRFRVPTGDVVDVKRGTLGGFLPAQIADFESVTLDSMCLEMCGTKLGKGFHAVQEMVPANGLQRFYFVCWSFYYSGVLEPVMDIVRDLGGNWLAILVCGPFYVIRHAVFWTDSSEPKPGKKGRTEFVPRRKAGGPGLFEQCSIVWWFVVVGKKDGRKFGSGWY